MVAGRRRPRAREIGFSFEGTTGPWNAITDVPGVEVGQVTVVASDSVPTDRRHWVRTGVTAVLPRGRDDPRPVFAGLAVLNGNGEMTGSAWVEESGRLEGPILSTNTDVVGLVRDAVVAWMRERGLSRDRWALPVVGETWDGYLHDVGGRHLREEHVRAALDGARSGPTVEEGNVGGGTAAICYGFKGGIGTASRTLVEPGPYQVGVLVQANHGRREDLRVAGVPVGRSLGTSSLPELGSILVFVGTDAPLLPHQLRRVARRAGLGVARTGSISGNGSGDFFLAFSTVAPGPDGSGGRLETHSTLPNESLDPLFAATVQAVEEAIVNSLVAAETMVGYQEHTVEAVPVERLREMLSNIGR